MGVKNGWLDWAHVIKGPADKVYTESNKQLGIANHSIVGYESESEDGVPNRFLDTSTNPNGSYTANAAASVHFVLRYSGLLIQMYPLSASCWTSGGRFQNTHFVAIELEGGYVGNEREPMRPAQVATYVKLIIELENHWGFPLTRDGVSRNIKEHNEWVPTACPSGRYELAYAALRGAPQEELVTRKEYEDLLIAQYCGSEAKDEKGNRYPREKLLSDALWRMEQARDGKATSMGDQAASGLTVAKATDTRLTNHIGNHTAGIYPVSGMNFEIAGTVKLTGK